MPDSNLRRAARADLGQKSGPCQTTIRGAGASLEPLTRAARLQKRGRVLPIKRVDSLQLGLGEKGRSVYGGRRHLPCHSLSWHVFYQAQPCSMRRPNLGSAEDEQ